MHLAFGFPIMDVPLLPMLPFNKGSGIYLSFAFQTLSAPSPFRLTRQTCPRLVAACLCPTCQTQTFRRRPRTLHGDPALQGTELHGLCWTPKGRYHRDWLCPNSFRGRSFRRSQLYFTATSHFRRPSLASEGPGSLCPRGILQVSGKMHLQLLGNAGKRMRRCDRI